MTHASRSAAVPRRHARPRVVWVAALVASFAATGSLWAQQQGQQPQTVTVTGQVVNAATGEPVSNVEVVVLGTTRSSVTGERGEFRLAHLRPGTYRIRANSLGFRTAGEDVDVSTAGMTQRVVLRIAPTAIPLDQVVVTGQAAAATRRQIAHSIVTIDANALSNAPVSSLSQLLQSRAPGVNILPSGGKPGQGSRLVLRGVGSLAQDFGPIVYIDGVRLDNEAESGLSIGGASWSGLDDLNVYDIDHIEIVKGASAAALYGTEAASGVVQIFTKQGTGAQRQVHFRSQVGGSSTPASWWGSDANALWFHDRLVRTGFSHRQNVSVRGSIDRFSYYASGSFGEEDGNLPASAVKQYGFRSNMRLSPAQTVQLSGSVGYGRRDIQFPLDGDHAFGLVRHALLGGASGVPVLGSNEVPPERIPEVEIFLNSSRFTAGMALDFVPTRWFTHRLTLGGDVLNTDNTEWHEYGSVSDYEGSKANVRRQATTLNMEYIGRVQGQLGARFSSSTAFGMQAYVLDDVLFAAKGFRFAGPGLRLVTATGVNQSAEDRFKRKHVGYFVEEQIGLDDVLFLTAGARLDGHSNFGPEERYQIYPRLGASYVLSEHVGLPDAFGTVRLRTAYGRAGQQPGEFSAVRFWRSFAASGSAGLTTGNIGNDSLAPEKSREFEAGLDVALLQNRLGLEVTFYDRSTDGVLVPVEYPPSFGWPLPRYENLGTIENRGVEATASAALIDRGRLQWRARGSIAVNRNRIVDTAGLDPIHVAGAQWHQPGYAVAGFFADRYELIDGVLQIVRGDYIGPAFPTLTLQVHNEVMLGANLTLGVLVDHRGGHYLESNTLRERALLADPTAGRDRSRFIFPADVWRLREVTLAYDLPRALTRPLNFSGATLSLSGRNLVRSQKYAGTEVEAHYNALVPYGNQTWFDTPLPRQLFAALSVNF